MNVDGTKGQKKGCLFSPRRSVVANISSPAKNNSPSLSSSMNRTNSSSSCCRGFSNCKILEPSAVTQPQQHPPKTNQQVIELETELGKQKELRAMYKMRMERTQDYLRYCLQVAQDKGFLDIILNDHHKDSIMDGGVTENLPTPPPPIPHNSDLSAIVYQAKTNGWYIEPNEIELHEKVGQGSTADIHKGIWRGLEVAVKCLNPDFFESNENAINFFAQEVETLSKQRHRFVLHLMGACLNPPLHGWVVTEYFATTLKEWMHGQGKRRKERTVVLPPLKERVTRALEISQAMQYLHGHKPMIIHRDLKPSNIFLDDAFHVRVADFGHARFLTHDEKALTGETGTYVYVAPEVIRCEPYNEKCDVYSFGIILNELITGEDPYIGDRLWSSKKIALEVAEGKIRPALIETGLDEQLEELNALIQLSWDEDASIRPTFATITCHLRDIQTRLI